MFDLKESAIHCTKYEFIFGFSTHYVKEKQIPFVNCFFEGELTLDFLFISLSFLEILNSLLYSSLLLQVFEICKKF